MIGPGIKLTTYFSERQRSGGRFLADALIDLYERHRLHTSVLLRGVDGFGERRHLHSDRLLSLSENLPAVSIAIDTQARIEQALPEVLALENHGLVSVERAQVAWGEELTELGDRDGAVKLTVYGGRSSRLGLDAAYVKAVEVMKRAGISGASVLLAVDGTLHGQRRRARFFGRNARVPLMLLALGEADALKDALQAIAGLIEEPVATFERVRICKADGAVLAEPHGNGQPAALQKLMVHCEEQAKWRGHALHVELVRRLREAGAAGATVLRGVRGFYGNREVFHDRVLSLRRNVPVHVVIVDTPSNVRRWWPIVDEATAQHGIVTSELVW